MTAAVLALALAASPTVPLSPCQLSHPITPASVAASCGTFEVPEDRSRPDGRRIPLAIAVVRADAPRPKADPVFVLAGGPGQAIRELFPILAPSFGRIARDRDLVLVDQRGTGGSGRLSCPALDAAERVFDEPAKELAAIADCARSLRADLSKYGTDDFVEDLEAVRAALGYGPVNVVGFSYGTRAALAWLRAHPAGVRALALDGVTPPDYVIGGSFEQDAQRALDRLFARCAADRACRASYPDPAGELRALEARIAGRPERVRTHHPRTGAPLEPIFGVDALRAVVDAFLYESETAALLPAMLHAAAAGDLAALAAQAVATRADLEAGLSRPLQLSVVCAEDVPLLVDRPRGTDERSFLGRSIRDAFRRSCAAWPVPRKRPEWRQPFEAKVPALLLSGEADPATPPRWAERLAKVLPNARQVVLAGQGHGVFTRGCVPRLVGELFDAGSASGLDLSCAKAIQPPPVFVDLLGGSP